MPADPDPESIAGLDGTVSYSFDDYYTGSSQHYENSYAWDDYGLTFAGFTPGGVWFQIYRGPLTVSDVGKRQTQYHWERNIDFMTGLPDPNDNPPDFLILKITAGVNGSVCTDLSNPYNTNSDASVTISLMGESGGTDTSWTDSSGAHFKGLGQTATKLFAIPTNGQEDIWGPWINYGAEIQMDGDRYISPDTNLLGQASIDLSYSPAVDTRKLTLHRSNAINETTDEDGVTHGDTTYSYADYTDNVNWNLVENHQTFTPSFEGNWNGGTSSPNVTWNWAPVADFVNPAPSKLEGVWAAPVGDEHYNSYSPEGWEGSATGPQTVNVVYSAKDNTDGATATSIYVLTVHDAWENLRSDPAQSPTLESVYFPSGPSAGNQWAENASGPEGLTGTWSQSIDVSHSFDTSVSGGFTVDDFANLGVTFTESTSQSIGTQFGSTSSPIPIGYHCYPYVRLQWNRNYYLVDHYIPAGHDINLIRANTNGKTDATHDGSWEQWLDDYQGGYSVGWSQMYDIRDFDGDGLPD